MSEPSALLYQFTRALKQQDYRVASSVLTDLMEFCRDQSGEKMLGLFRGVECADGSDYIYVTHLGTLWELTLDGWQQLLERIVDERGYALNEFGICLSYEVHDLSAMTKDEAARHLRD
jgi:hypothetical protein